MRPQRHPRWTQRFRTRNDHLPGSPKLMRASIRKERAAFNAAISAGSPLRLHEQERWMNDDLRLPEMFHYLLDESDAYRGLVFAPYLFWPAFACGQVAPDRTILMPCLHDEPEAYLDLFHPVFSGCPWVLR